MIEERAVILSLQSEPSQTQTTATLEIERKTACGLCGQTRGCGNSIWGKLFGHQTTAFKAQNRINAKVGDSVIVGINEKALLKSALLLYILPLVTLFIGAILASQLWHSDGSTMLGAAAGLVLGLLWVKGHTMSNRYFSLQQPVILRLVGNETEIKFN
jgi:sigma-E factor negative regulatory protein RseC